MTRFAARLVPAAFFALMAVARREPIEDALARLGAASNQADAMLAGLVLSYLVLGALFYVIVAALFVRRHQARSMLRNPVATVIAFAGAWAAAPLAMLPMRTDDLTLALIANGLMVVGIAASCACLAVLGRSFGIRAGARELVTRGPYARVRHPLYVAEAITQLGLLVLVLSPYAVLVFVLYLLLQMRRATLEERVLEGVFPDYRDYRARTARFIPGLI